MSTNLSTRLKTLDRAEWSIRIDTPYTAGELSQKVLFAHHSDAVLNSAGLGKVLLLLELAERVNNGDLDMYTPVNRRKVDPVRGQGLWMDMTTDVLPLGDAAALAASVGDNWAINALLHLVGIEDANKRSWSLGLHYTYILDVARGMRLPENPRSFSETKADDMLLLLDHLFGHKGPLSSNTRSCVHGWLGLNRDLSMVASALGLDPLNRRETDRGLRLWNTTGADTGVRAEMGRVDGVGGSVMYTAIANFNDQRDPALRHAVLDDMRTIGTYLKAQVSR